MLEFESIHKWKTAVLYLRNCLVKFCRINDENPDKIGAFLGYIFFVASWWQRYKDSNLKWRSQRLAIFFQNRLFKPFFRICVSQNSLRIIFLLRTANSYEKLRTLHRGVVWNAKSTALVFYFAISVLLFKTMMTQWIQRFYHI